MFAFHCTLVVDGPLTAGEISCRPWNWLVMTQVWKHFFDLGYDLTNLNNVRTNETRHVIV